MKVSIIIPFKDKTPILEECVETVKKQRYKDIEIILVSDRRKIKDKDIISLVNPRCKGVGDKRNLGARMASGDILFFLDSDCTVKPDTITELVKLFNKIDTDAISGKPLAPKHGNLLGMATGLEYEDRFNRMGENYVTVAATTCFGVKKNTFKRFGGFKDYSLKEATGEDWDFSRRFTTAEYKIFHTNKVQVYHNHASDTIKKWFKRRIEHSAYRIAHRRRYGQVFEEYFNVRMFIDTTFLLSIPAALRMYEKSKRPEVLTLPLFATLRNIAWFIGMIRGLVTR